MVFGIERLIDRGVRGYDAFSSATVDSAGLSTANSGREVQKRVPSVNSMVAQTVAGMMPGGKRRRRVGGAARSCAKFEDWIRQQSHDYDKTTANTQPPTPPLQEP